MAEWRPLHQSVDFRSGLETGGQSYDPPLLPYEKSLITALDCSEEEYRKFVRYAMQRAHVRPAEYAHIPDIQAVLPVLGGLAGAQALGATSAALAGGAAAKGTTAIVLTNLAIGVALTAASLLLSPKAPSLEDAKIKSRKLKNQIGPTRFNQASSFDNAPSLAELNQPIPIPFGKRGTGADGVLTGGLILAPALVWSRLYAYGKFQAYEGVYVAGEFGLDSPDLGGILLGTSALTASAQTDFAFYWSSQQGGNRPATLLHGTEDQGLPEQLAVKSLLHRKTLRSLAKAFPWFTRRAVTPASAPVRQFTTALLTGTTGKLSAHLFLLRKERITARPARKHKPNGARSQD